MNINYELTKQLNNDRIREAQQHNQAKRDDSIRLNKRQRRNR